MNTPTGKALTGLFVLVFAGIAFWVIKGQVGPSERALDSRQRIFICTETGKTFNHEISAGEAFPVYSPHSGKNTGIFAEACYWTKDGKTKETPTYVAVKPSGPTFCPDCGRLVVGHNPRPSEGMKPPPTQAEYIPRANNSER